jgi:Predicted 3'-5' exonuclease related to the exonuclease domain of PolB
MATLVIDIETGACDEASIQRAVENYKLPSNLRNVEKIEAKRKEAEARIRERSALLIEAPILCIGASMGGQVVLFNGMDTEKHGIHDRAMTVLPCGSEQVMLETFRLWMDQVVEAPTELVGFNIKRWDAPKLRHASLKYKLPLPAYLQPSKGVPITDVMEMYTRYFSLEDKLFISLNDVAHGLGIVTQKQIVDGSKVPALYEQGRYSEILTYCALDVLICKKAWLLMTGQVL